MTITALYAALLSVMLVFLILRIARLRWVLRVGIGDGGEKILHKAIRAHGNFVETVPWAMFLMLLMEMTQALSATGLYIYGTTLVAARLAHAWGISRHSGATVGRMGGIILTISLILAAAGLCLYRQLTGVPAGL